jgi:plasmid maintenance system antidote protein VapI
MSKSKQPTPITDLLRKTIKDALDAGETTLLTLEQETGVIRASIMRFVKGRQSLRLDVADKLAAHLGLELRRVGKGR